MRRVAKSGLEALLGELDAELATGALQGAVVIVQLNGGGFSAVEMPILSPKRWDLYRRSSVVGVETLDLDTVARVLDLEMAKEAFSHKVLLLDGFLATVSMLYSNVIDRGAMDHSRLSFGKVYEVLSKLAQHEEQGGKVWLCELPETFQVIENVYLPVKPSDSWELLLAELEEGEVNGEDFQNLHSLVNGFVV